MSAACCFWAQLIFSVYAGHYTKNIIIYCVYTNLGGGSAGNSSRRKNKLEYGVVNAGEVARSRGLVFLWAERKGVYVDATIRGTGVVLERLNNIKIRALTLREAVLAVELQLGGYNGVLAPAVHVKGSLRKNEGAGIGYIRARRSAAGLSGKGEVGGSIVPVTSGIDRAIRSTGHLEETRSSDESVLASGFGGTTESVDGIGEGVNGIGVVEGLGAKSAVEESSSIKGRAVVNVGIRLDNPDKLLAGVVEVELNLVGGRADGLVTRELELLNEVLVGVLCHLAALISVKKDVVNIEGSGNKGLLVSLGDGLGSRGAVEGLDGPEALTERTDVKVNFYFVILYESLIPSLSRYLSAFSCQSTYKK